MRYFKHILKPRTDISEGIINLTRSIELDSMYDEQHTETYLVQDNDTLEDISYKLYDEVQYWWVVALLAKIKDPIFDLPLSNDALKRYFSFLVANGELADTQENWNALKVDNNSKRTIIVLKNEYLIEFVEILKNKMAGE